ncbi:MAG: GatB/YqeY domain-containing protein [Alphaproteobacteria bacterium]
MSIRDELQTNLKEAMKAKDSLSAATIRLILAAIKDRDITARVATDQAASPQGINDQEIMSMLQSMIKQRHESIALYQKANRSDLVDQEQGEILIITKFLPQQMDEAQIKTAVEQAIDAIKPQGLKDMSKVMAQLREQHVGKMDFKLASDFVKQHLLR